MRRSSPETARERTATRGRGALRLVATRKGDAMGVRRGEAGEEGLEDALAADLDGSFERLVLVFQDRLFGFAFRLSGRREDAEEIAQDAFVRAYRALTTYPPERIRAIAIRAWLYRIALNVARNRFRRKRHTLVSIDHGAVGSDGEERNPLELAADPDQRPDRTYEKRREREDIAALVRRLPERFRAPIVLRYVQGLPVEEVASILNQPVGTAKSNLHRGVRALRAALSESRGARPRALEVIR